MESDTIADVKLRITILSLSSIFAVFFVTQIVRAQNTVITEQTPAQRCELTQNYLKNIQRPRDLRARVNRLQAYQYIHQRLEVFVVRLEKNDQPRHKELRSQLNDLKIATESFKNSYEAYDQAREAVANLEECRTNITKFQQNLSQARLARQAVHEDVLKIQNLLTPEIPNQLKELKQVLELDAKATNE